jgi:heat shock protein HslJ
MSATQILAVACLFIATFAFGMCLTWPPLPTGQRFVAISLNGQPIIRTEHGIKLPTFGVWRGSSFYRFEVSGTGHCNSWWGTIILFPPNFIIWSDIYRTAVGCAGHDSEERYFRALLGATRWRRQGGLLILEHGADILRFALLQ